MPSSPKFRYGKADVWVVEVFQKLKTKHLAQSDSHIAVSAKVKENLECVGNSTHPSHYNCKFAVGHIKGVVCNNSHCVGKENLFCKAYDKSANTLGKFFKAFFPVLNLVGNSFVPYNRSCNQLWEKADVKSNI